LLASGRRNSSFPPNWAAKTDGQLGAALAITFHFLLGSNLAAGAAAAAAAAA